MRPANQLRVAVTPASGKTEYRPGAAEKLNLTLTDPNTGDGFTRPLAGKGSTDCPLTVALKGGGPKRLPHK